MRHLNQLRLPRRQALLLLTAIVVPCLVPLLLGWRMMEQDRQLEEKRRAEERRLLVVEMR